LKKYSVDGKKHRKSILVMGEYLILFMNNK
jgi:hypothetical protein